MAMHTTSKMKTRGTPNPRTYGASHMPRSPGKGVCVPKFSNIGFLNYILLFFGFFMLIFGRFCPFWGDLEPDLRPDLGRKLG